METSELSARLAVAEERARIAHELHDVVAHGLSVIAIQAGAADAALDHDPALARESMRQVRAAACESLGEMRRLLEMLRAGSAACDLGPQPGLSELPALVERVRASGVPVSLDVDGDPCATPAGVDLSAYRIVQEALANVCKHAGRVPTEVRVGWARDAVTVAVRDCGPCRGESDPGHGILGMRERVRMLGGELRTGPLLGGGFAVEAVLPL